MVDIFSKEKRSEIMSKIQAKNTHIELLVFGELKKRGIYFQKHYKKAPGSPDIALPRKRKAVFIDGGFWHGYKFKQRCGGMNEYWLNKISGNMKRDARNRRLLRLAGWDVMRVWDHEFTKKRIDKKIEEIIDFLK